MTSTTSRSETDDDRWFFGQISREKASQYLADAGRYEGTFLVRESTSSPGNFVLSFISDSNQADVLICQHWDDAFYSLITDPRKIFHGLDILINYYCEHSIAGPNGTILNQACVGEPPPVETRLHGSSNLLHRAVSQGNITVVTELLKSGYRKIDAKNNSGQTALHIACIKENEDFVKLLLDALAAVDVRDQDGLTSLQLACRHNNVGIVKLLIEEGGANIQLRTPLSGEVALHEAAASGSLEALKELLIHRAPAWPRSAQNRTPALLAKTNMHSECYRVIVNHRPPIPQIRLPEYYQGHISRQVAKELLLNSCCDGKYLLRKSSRSASEFVLSLTFNEKVYHYQIQRKKQMYFIDDGPYFKCLETLIDHYSWFCDGLPCKLTSPVPPNTPVEEDQFRRIYLQDINGNPMRDDTYSLSEHEPLLSSANSEEELLLSPEEFLAVDRWFSPLGGADEGGARPKNNNHKDSSESRSSPSQNGPTHFDVSTTVSSVTSPLPIINSSSQPILPSFDSLKIISSSTSGCMKGNKTKEVFGSIDTDSLSIGRELGVGEFGSVLKGIWTSPSGDEIAVAVKTLHNNDSATTESFLREAQVMMDLNHPYIVKLLGVCHGPPVAMVQELAPTGSLLNFLLDFPEQIQPEFHFKLWAAQVADGMKYLEQKHFVHRDLATRNLLVDSPTLIKISDFGLSRALNSNTDYYKATQGGRWPLKWYAPESIFYGQFTTQSDVWSYGVTLWEMHTYGDQPYGELTGHEVAELVEKGERLPRPTACPSRAYDIMLRCWDGDAKKRPSFKSLVALFRGAPDYVNIKPYFKRT